MKKKTGFYSIIAISVIATYYLFFKKKKDNVVDNFNALPNDKKENFETAKRILSEKYNTTLVNIALKQLKAESNFNRKAKSAAGAMGIAQFMPATWAEYGEGDPYNVEDSVRAYIRFNQMLGKKFRNRPDIILSAYNWGQNRKVLIDAYNNNESWQSLKNKLPQETRNYVEKILF